MLSLVWSKVRGGHRPSEAKGRVHCITSVKLVQWLQGMQASIAYLSVTVPGSWYMTYDGGRDVSSQHARSDPRRFQWHDSYTINHINPPIDMIVASNAFKLNSSGLRLFHSVSKPFTLFSNLKSSQIWNLFWFKQVFDGLRPSCTPV